MLNFINKISNISSKIQPITSDLIFYLDSSVCGGCKDISGNSLHGVSNGVSYRNKLYNFNKVGSHLDIPLINLTNNFSVEVYFLLDEKSNIDNKYHNIFTIKSDKNSNLSLRKIRSGLTNGLNIEYLSNGDRWVITTGGVIEFENFDHCFGPVYKNLTSWTHVVITMNGDIMHLYINGSYNTSLRIGNKWCVNDSLIIGDSIESMLGKVSVFRVYNKALSASEIGLNYSSLISN